MRRSIFWACAAGVVAATLITWRNGVPEPPAPDTAPVVPSGRLPVLGTVGDLPPAAERLVIEADARGRVFVDGKPVGMEALRDLLQLRADAAREEVGPRASKLAVVLRVDRDLPWLGAQWLMQACADPRSRIFRIFFAALPEAGGEEGAIATFLPSDVGLQPSPVLGPVRMTVELLTGGARKTLPRRDLYRVLRWVAEKHRVEGDEVQARIQASAAVPAGRVLEAVDLCLRSGVQSLAFQGTRLQKEESLEAAVAALPPWNGLISFLVGGDGVPLAPSGSAFAPPVGRTTGRFAGQATEPPEVPFNGDDLADPVEVDPAAASLPDGNFGRAVLPSMFSGRRNGKPALLTEGGAGTEDSVEAGLQWLKDHQSPGGGWDCDGFEGMCKKNKCGGAGALPYDPGVSGLATLAFLGAGETHKTARYGPVVRNALKYLKAIQDAEGCFGPRVQGGLDDCVEDPGWNLRMRNATNKFTYGHAIAALAMTEAYGMTRSPLFKASAQNGVNFIHQCQNPYLAWRYGVRPQDNDTSVTGWMVLALRVAKEAGLEVDPAAFDGARAWLDKVTDPESGRTGYTARDNGPSRAQELLDRFPPERSESLTAEAVLARILCGARADDAVVLKGADLCGKAPPRWDGFAGTVDFCYWHFGSLALFQVGGERWTAWSGAVDAALLGAQRKDPDDDRRGSWDPADPWGSDGGRVYATAINVLTLETPRRYTKFGPAR